MAYRFCVENRVKYVSYDQFRRNVENLESQLSKTRPEIITSVTLYQMYDEGACLKTSKENPDRVSQEFWDKAALREFSITEEDSFYEIKVLSERDEYTVRNCQNIGEINNFPTRGSRVLMFYASETGMDQESLDIFNSFKKKNSFFQRVYD